MRRGACAVTVAVAAGALLPAARAACNFDAPSLVTEIPAQPMWSALENFALQTRLNVGSEADDVARVRRSRRVPAGTAPEDALRRMLRGTGLRYECVAARVVRIHAQPPAPPPVETVETREDELAEAIVTGERNQPIRTDTKVWTTADLREAGAKGIDGIARRTPGVEFNALSSVSSGPYTNIAIRGVADRHGNTAGIWFDDVPLPAIASNTFIRGYPYVFDVARVEVLRGPQPVLLGANAQGGAVQFMSRQPSLAQFDGEAMVELATTEGGDFSWEGGAAFGGPVEPERLGLRVSGWYREEGGYVDRVDPFTRAVVERDANRIDYGSARVAASIRLNPSAMLLPSLYYQSTEVRDSSQFMLWEAPALAGDTFSEPRDGEFRNGSLIRQPFGDSYVLASMKSLFEVGGLDLQGVTGYVDRSAFMVSEDTESRRWGSFGSPLGLAYPADAADLVQTRVRTKQRSFTQQVKLVADEAGPLSWVAGAFFAHTRTRETDRVHAPYSTPPAIQAGLGWDTLDLTVPTVIVRRQLAGYGLATWRPGEPLKLSAGLRIERHRSSADVTVPADMPPLPARMAPLDTDRSSSNTVAAPQFGVEYDAGDAAAGRVSEYHLKAGKGYAPGSIEAARPTCLEPSTVYPADTLWSYEAGMRQGWHRRVQLDVNLFHIAWNNGREARRTCLFMHMPGKARSRGLDFAARVQAWRGFEVALEASYVDARYMQTLYNDGSTRIVDVNGRVLADGSLIVSKGDAIGTPPLVASPWNVTMALEQRIGLGSSGTLLLRAEQIHRSRNAGPFYTAHPDFYPAYQAPDLEGNPATQLLNFRASFRRGAVDLDLFIDNLLDARPVLQKRNKGNDRVTLFYATTERPRTIGFSMNWKPGTGH